MDRSSPHRDPAGVWGQEAFPYPERQVIAGTSLHVLVRYPGSTDGKHISQALEPPSITAGAEVGLLRSHWSRNLERKYPVCN